MHFPQWSIKVRLIVTLGTLATVLATVGAMGINDLNSSNAALRDMHANKLIPTMSLARALDLLGGERTSLHRALGTRDAAHADAFQQSLKSDDGDLAQLLATFHAAELSPDEKTISWSYPLVFTGFSRESLHEPSPKLYRLVKEALERAGVHTTLRDKWTIFHMAETALNPLHEKEGQTTEKI